jgi:tetratricopeptide (TPR) repeat protein
VASPELSPSGKSLEEAEQLYSAKSFDRARELFLKALEQTGLNEEHAQSWYGLGRIALQQNQPDSAVKFFDKAVTGSPDAFTKAWSLLYLGRLAHAAGEDAKAADFYKDAIGVPGASAKAVEAARKELAGITK